MDTRGENGVPESHDRLHPQLLAPRRCRRNSSTYGDRENKAFSCISALIESRINVFLNRDTVLSRTGGISSRYILFTREGRFGDSVSGGARTFLSLRAS